MLRDFYTVPYIPILAVRPSEMNALAELPDADKKVMLPLIMIGPWVGSNDLSNTIQKIIDVYDGKLPWIADLNSGYTSPEEEERSRRDVHDQIEELMNPTDGFANWCAYVKELPNAIPCLQLNPDSGELDSEQVDALYGLDRGLVLRLKREHFANLNRYLTAIEDIPVGEVLFVIDFEQVTPENLLLDAAFTQLRDNIAAQREMAPIAVSASSFPYGFDGIPNADIQERGFFNRLRAGTNNAHLIYSDYGSARAKNAQAGGGEIYPRIDYPLSTAWVFSRQKLKKIIGPDGKPTKKSEPLINGYQRAAAALTQTEGLWDGKLRIWGTQKIEQTVLADPHSITSPARATAVRINIHLHRQVNYDTPDALYNTEDEYVD